MENVVVKTKMKMPILPVRGLVLLPNNEIKIEVGREFSKEALKAAENLNGNKIFVVAQPNPEIEEPTTDDLFEYGVIGQIKMKMRSPNGTMRVIIRGLERGRITKFIDNDEMFEGLIEPLESYVDSEIEELALVRKLMASIEEFGSMRAVITPEVVQQITGGVTSEKITDIIAYNLPLTIDRKEEYLETINICERLRMLLSDFEQEKEIAEIEASIEQKIRSTIDQNQKEYYLREKLRVIKEELGDVANREDDSDELRQLIEDLPLPEVVREKALLELKRYETMPSSSQEANIVRTYLDWILSLPWNNNTVDNEDLNKAINVLNTSHYGLDKVKERIVEYLAVKQMTKSLKGPIICLVGPPGVGKTSLAKSIADSLERRFVKMSLGGVRDEAEIRGHRRTYIGAMPGRIIQGMRKAGSNNPVFLLDEIDKMTSDFKGDPASALLEVLDPEQNAHFSDHYLEEEYDLSNVMFIATANYLYQIPEALRDRLEIIELSGYTELEKLHIAKEHLVSKQLKQHGLKKSQLKINDKTLLEIIRKYTREAGVRNLEREIAKICRKLVREILTTETDKLTISPKNIEKYLGQERFTYGMKENSDQVGVATGLAYTAFGGDILPIEVTYFKGKGSIVLTGSLGDVMKESAQIAFSYIKSHAADFGIPYELISENDFHIHVPEGAVPKDGPSAGITLTTALISALTNKTVKRDVGMTGEITLRGHVLPIGGLKEKSLSAHRSGLKTVIIPKENEKDLEEISDEIKSQLEFIPVTNFKQVLEVAINK